ncbi:50S ribosomal protein L24 [candidate division Kazan bacterium RIFCSPHIGHO2_01_FULL_44_14]|uniref:Large ribosomal subunit protein uL24 n=1 Tax=candidate division Kazan bacterium RIFCSPLOWO2_01_FULL_45_19 TaxID=1798538 RepID=A0A1F4NPM1_UNCK3|nr:hypothetical protein [uncultured bacterium]OGB73403.1 MAG: 50S ribosomal protein L24 [candidate division Kazan bacterium RIFCSPLOWO2_01_FULL_45_19]OGB77648.1 MAG: 50S ribosomal protein L24 [candidate division Kazan bacterium RIFCSPHIGHO2_01_FULL_44_14]
MRIKTGDKVLVIRGKDRGKTGLVKVADRITERVKVEGINIYKRHQRGGRQNRQPGGIVEVVAALSAANVMVICPSCSHPTRIGHRLDGKTKHRICKNCQAIIENVKK